MEEDKRERVHSVQKMDCKSNSFTLIPKRKRNNPKSQSKDNSHILKTFVLIWSMDIPFWTIIIPF